MSLCFGRSDTELASHVCSWPARMVQDSAPLYPSLLVAGEQVPDPSGASASAPTLRTRITIVRWRWYEISP
jgi:hypothetical protein